MIAPIMALFNRSIRVEARSIWTYLVRVGLVGSICVMLLVTWLWSMMSNAPGLVFFTGVIYIDLVIVIGVGIAYFASAITEEKEEMTLGLLIMTGLSPVSILMGKSTSRLITVLFLLMAQFPFTLLAITLGGVSMDQVWATYVTLLSFAVFIGNMSLFCSVYCQRARAAAVMATVFFILFLCLPLMIHGVHELCVYRGWLVNGGDASEALMARAARIGEMNPFTRLEAIRFSGFTGSPISFQAVSNVIGGGVFFLLSYAIFNWRSREQKVAAPSRGLVLKGDSSLRLISAGRSWSKALMWKDFNFLVGGKSGLIVKLILLLLVAGAVYLFNYFEQSGRGIRWNRIAQNTSFFILMTGWLGCAAELSIQAGRVFKSEVKWKTHSSLMTLPISMASIVGQKIAGCLLGLIPWFVYFFVGMVIYPDHMADFNRDLFRGDADGLGGMIIALSIFILFLYLNAFYSLILKWGAFPLALLTVVMGTQCTSGVIMIPMALASRGGQIFNSIWPMVFLAVGFCALLTVILHVGIAKQLERAASEGQ